MEIDNSVPTNPIIERKLTIFPQHKTCIWATNVTVQNSNMDLILELVKSQDLQVENPAALLSDDFVKIETIEIDDDSDSTETPSKRAREDSSGRCSPPQFIVRRNSADYVDWWEPPRVQVGEIYLAPVYHQGKTVWLKAQILERHEKCFTMQVQENGKIIKVNRKLVALTEPVDNFVKTGKRVLVAYVPETGEKGTFKLAVVGEYPCKSNHDRYLVIFEEEKWELDVWAYVSPTMIRPLLHTRQKVWRDSFVWQQNIVKDLVYKRYENLKNFGIGENVIVSVSDSKDDCYVLAEDCSLIWIWSRNNQKALKIHRGSPDIQRNPKQF